MKTKKNWGFTIIELMVVMTIIAILATLGINSYTAALRKGRDAKKISDLNTLKQSLVMYRADNGVYPGTLPELRPDYIGEIPTPPNGGSYNYTSDGTGFEIIAQLETPSGNHTGDNGENTAYRVTHN